MKTSKQRYGPRIAMIGAVLMWAPCASAATDDSDISSAIAHEFLHDDAVPFDRISIDGEDGVVTLEGQVSNIGAKAQAEQLAAIVKGVRSVTNLIEVEPQPVRGPVLAQRIYDALQADPATEAYQIEAETGTAGRVILIGEVDSWAERSLAEHVVMTVAGVTAIDNQLTVSDAFTYRHEADIGDEIRGRLRWDVRVDDSLIDVLAREGGRVTLSGTVGSLAEKQRAVQLAHVTGVSRVDAEHLDVERWARDEDLRRGKYEAKSDAEISAALERALAYDPRVLGAEIHVRVEAGTAWLTGAVDHLHAKTAAAADAMDTVGVDHVVNHLQVKPEVLTDQAITEQIENGLRSEGLMTGNDIVVSVQDRSARLTGDVDTSVEYWQANRIASRARGLESLENDLTIGGKTPTLVGYWSGFYPRVTESQSLDQHGAATDRQIHENVRSELFWSPFVNEDAVAIDVEDGAVTLTGTVSSKRERTAATDNAFEGGAVTVRNDLTIEQ